MKSTVEASLLPILRSRGQGVNVTCIHRPAYYYAMHRVDYTAQQHFRGDTRMSRTMITENNIPGITDPDFYAQRYRRAVLAADAQLGAILAALHAAERFDPALIIITADHGESLTEQPLWFDHGTAPAAEQLHVPLLIKLPFQARAGERVSAPVSLVDLLPTALAVSGLIADPTLDGRSLLGPLPADRLLLGEDSHCKEHPALPCAPRGPRGKSLAARDAAFSLLRRPTAAGPVYTLFDRRADPAELKPLDTPPPAALVAAVDAAAAARSAVDWPVETPTSGD